ncbi:MAG: hypothetical protein HYY16_02515 [Planctomycetes bacterium]|nr:hypothetical protein [Planctomycetota bacterium]
MGPRLWGYVLCASTGATALGLALPWQNTVFGARWAFSSVEGWGACVACVVGLGAAVHSLLPKTPPEKRRRLTVLSVLCSVLVLGFVGVFAVRMLAADDPGVGSGPGSIVTAMADLAWIFAAVRRHAELRTRSRRPGRVAR